MNVLWSIQRVMKYMVLLAAGVSILAGCATKEMKSTPFYAQGEDGDMSWWSVPALLSWGGGWSNKICSDYPDREIKAEENSRSDGKILLGLGGWYRRVDASHENGQWWAFPFINRKRNVSSDSKREPTTETQVTCYFAGWETCYCSPKCGREMTTKDVGAMKEIL